MKIICLLEVYGEYRNIFLPRVHAQLRSGVATASDQLGTSTAGMLPLLQSDARHYGCFPDLGVLLVGGFK